MKLLWFLLPIFYLSVTEGSTKTGGGYKEAILSCDAYIDSTIKELLEENGDYFDPHFVNNSLLTFQKKVVFVNFKGEAKITEGHISGLRNLHRVSSCALSFEQGRLMISSKLQVDKMAFNFTGSLKAININKTISGNIDTSKVYLSTVISLDADGKESVLEALNVDFISDINIEVEGTRFLGWMEETMKNSIGQFFKTLTEKLVDSQMKKLWTEKMVQKPFSLAQFELDTDDLEVTTTEEDPYTGTPVYTKEDSNAYIDSVLDNRFHFEADYSKLEPYTLGDGRINKVYITAEKDNYMDLKNGKLEYLTNIKRVQDCSQPVLRNVNITFTCYLRFEQSLRFIYAAESHNGNAISRFDIVGLVDDTRLAIKVTTTVSDNVPSMLQLNVNNLGRVRVKAAHTIADSLLVDDSLFVQTENTYDKDTLKSYFADKTRKIILGKFKDVLGYSIYKTPIHFVE